MNLMEILLANTRLTNLSKGPYTIRLVSRPTLLWSWNYVYELIFDETVIRKFICSPDKARDTVTLMNSAWAVGYNQKIFEIMEHIDKAKK